MGLRMHKVAERQGFEPWRRFPAYTRSRRAPSTTRPPLRQGGSSRKSARYARVERRLIGVLEDLGQDTSRTVEPGRHRQVLRTQKFRVVDLRLVARAVIAEDRHDGLAGAEIAGETHRPGDVDARRAAEAKALMLEKVEDDRQRLGIGDRVGEIRGEALQIGGDPALPDALGDRAALRLRLTGAVDRGDGRAFGVGE